MSNDTSSTYDAVLYPSYVHPQTHPDRLAAQAALFGFEPAPPATCRVLELGCGDGTNLLPVAADLPGSRVVGIDLAARPIAAGQERARRFGLSNLTLRQMDAARGAAAAAAELGEFDYVIAHGLYSWLPAAARDGVLALCRACLAPRGLAYVSYNALPGGYFRRMVREMTRYHLDRTAAGAAPADRVAEARGLLRFLAESQASFLPEGAAVGMPPGPDRPWTQVDDYALALRRYHERVAEKHDAVFFHDELADENVALYFHEFAAHAARHGLSYLTEAALSETRDYGLRPTIRQTLQRLAGGDVGVLEQYADFVCGRRFRQSLLCRGGTAPPLWPDPRRVAGLCAASPAEVVADSVPPDGATHFRGYKGAATAVADPVGKAALRALGAAWPRPLGFGEVVAAARQRLAGGRATPTGMSDAQLADGVARALLDAAAANVLVLWAGRPTVVAAPSARPVASPLVRRQVEVGTQVVNLLGEPAQIEPPDVRRLLSLMDGSRDRPALARDLAPMFPGGGPTHAWLDDALARLARLALLTA